MFSSRFGLGLAFSLFLGLSVPVVVSATSRGSESPTAKAVGNWQTTPADAIAAAVYQMSLSEDGQRLAALTDEPDHQQFV